MSDAPRDSPTKFTRRLTGAYYYFIPSISALPMAAP